MKTAGCSGKSAPLVAPDLAIIDIAMPKVDGIKAARQIRAACPTTAVLMVSAFDYESYVLASLRAGAAGYMLKNAPVSELISAIRLLRNGETVFDQGAVSKVLRHLGDGETEEKVPPELHQRELEVLRLAAKGAGNREIGEAFGLSERTIQSHMRNIYRKLGSARLMMGTLRMGVDFVYSWPSAQVARITPEEAVDTIYKGRNKFIKPP